MHKISATLFIVFCLHTVFLRAQINTDSLAQANAARTPAQVLKQRQDSVDFLGFEGKYHEAIAKSFDNITFAEKIGDTAMAYYSRYFIAANYFYLQDYDNSKKFLKEYREYALAKKDTFRLARAYNLQGAINTSEEAFEEGIVNFKKSIPMFVRLQDSLQWAISNYNIAETYTRIKLLDSAKRYFVETKKILDGMKGFNGFTTEINNLSGQINMLAGNPTAAMEDYKKAIAFTEQGGYGDEQSAIAYGGYSEALFAANFPREAYLYRVKYDSLNKEIYKTEKLQIVENANAKYNLAQFKKEAMEGQLNNQLNKERYEAQKKLNILLLVFGAIIVMLLGLLLKNYRSKKTVS